MPTVDVTIRIGTKMVIVMMKTTPQDVGTMEGIVALVLIHHLIGIIGVQFVNVCKEVCWGLFLISQLFKNVVIVILSLIHI